MKRSTTIKLPLITVSWGDVCFQNCLLEVICSSRLELRKALQNIAIFAKFEGDYDFTPYTYLDNAPASNARSFLWTADDPYSAKELVFGGCTFRFVEWNNAEPCWNLDWIWLHPHYRGRGIFKRTADFFEKEFGKFNIQSPLSRNMLSYVNKYRPDLFDRNRIKTGVG